MSDDHPSFGLLGPLSVRDEAGAHPIRSSYQRILLAALLLHADRLVSVEELVALIWDDEPPERPRQALQNHVMRMRQLLGPRLAERLLTLPTGYLFHSEDAELDIRRFTEARIAGQTAAAVGAWEDARDQLHTALSLWRGEPLSDIASTRLQSEHCEALRQEHLTVRELCVDADINLQNYTGAVKELRALTIAHPWRESLHAKLMIALYGAGRQAEALAAFRDFRRNLIEELGIEPGTELQLLHQRILAQEPVRSLLDRDGEQTLAAVQPGPEGPVELQLFPGASAVEPRLTADPPQRRAASVSGRQRHELRRRLPVGVYLAVLAAFVAGVAVGQPLYGRPVHDQAISVEDPEPAVVKAGPDGGGGVRYVTRVGSDKQIMYTTSIEVPVVNEVPEGDVVVVSLGLTATTDGPVTVKDTAGNTYTRVGDVIDAYWHRAVIYAAFHARSLKTVDRVIISYPQSSKYHIAIDAFSGLSRASASVAAPNTYEHNSGSFTTSSTPLSCEPGDLLLAVVATNSGPPPVLAHGWQTLPPLKLSSYRLTTVFRYVTESGKCAVTGTNSTAQWAATAVVLHR
ncbi:AfsR/SARP family transcriptional regulator [Catenulispora subtropica]|uniref:OmpR/PhoB-type domain-containing protein n=1 Tax=Catenulispora subtropica TaxID=450798 RepID=A0ABN2R129_9ACTN